MGLFKRDTPADPSVAASEKLKQGPEILEGEERQSKETEARGNYEGARQEASQMIEELRPELDRLYQELSAGSKLISQLQGDGWDTDPNNPQLLQLKKEGAAMTDRISKIYDEGTAMESRLKSLDQAARVMEEHGVDLLQRQADLEAGIEATSMEDTFNDTSLQKGWNAAQRELHAIKAGTWELKPQEKWLAESEAAVKEADAKAMGQGIDTKAQDASTAEAGPAVQAEQADESEDQATSNTESSYTFNLGDSNEAIDRMQVQHETLARRNPDQWADIQAQSLASDMNRGDIPPEGLRNSAVAVAKTLESQGDRMSDEQRENLTSVLKQIL